MSDKKGRWSLYTTEGDGVSRLKKSCSKCGKGVFLAEHADRFSCGRCGYTEFKAKEKKQESSTEKENPKEKTGEADGKKAEPDAGSNEKKK